MRETIEQYKRKVAFLARENETLKQVKEAKQPDNEILNQLLQRMSALDAIVNVCLFERKKERKCV